MSFLDHHPGDPGAVNFDELANALLEQGELLSPSELQGCICGLLGGGLQGAEDAMLAELERTLQLSLHGVLAESAVTLRTAAIEPLTEGDLDFCLLLPDDDFELDERVSAMANWCRGFLSGYAQARVSVDGQNQAVAPDSAEALRDFAAIAQAAADADGDDPDRDEDDGEREYAELLEYLRVAAMNVLLDAGVGEDSSGAEKGS